MYKNIIRSFPKDSLIVDVPRDKTQRIRNEWLVTNGWGGYASGTIMGVPTRRYHGLLIAALPPPFGRYMMLHHLREEVIKGEKTALLNCEEMADGMLNIEALKYLKEFYLEDGLPVWVYQVDDTIIEKRLLMSYRQNTVYIFYELLEGSEDVQLKLSPAFNFRPHEAPVNTPLDHEYVVTAIGNRYEISKNDFIPVRMFIQGTKAAGFTMQEKVLNKVLFRTEMHRGYENVGDLWSPGYFHMELKKNQPVCFVASTESWKSMSALPPQYAKNAEIVRRRLVLQTAEAKDQLMQELVLAADQFIIIPEYRIEDIIRAHAFGEENRTVIAGYHWFTDWGRDTMISLEGLTLCTRRYQEARWIIKTFAHYVKKGLIPNMFPEGEKLGLYNTADATMWFFHAIDRYISVTRDTLILEEIWHVLEEIMQLHFAGTDFGIGMDPKDKLLKQGKENYQLTWMDAKVGDWVVTPRRGKTVEINALWYNALRLMEEWTDNDNKSTYGSMADQAQKSFNARFWCEEKGYLYDLVDGENGNDHSLRPNQIFSFSLKYPVLAQDKWPIILEKIKDKLLTPYGLRTLDIEHPDFKANYEGDLRSRDAAYHQGTVWPWLVGPFIDAWLKVHPKDKKGAAALLEKFSDHLSDAGMGSISEIFDAVSPFTPKGCIAQAWSIAEVLRAYLKTLI